MEHSEFVKMHKYNCPNCGRFVMKFSNQGSYELMIVRCDRCKHTSFVSLIKEKFKYIALPVLEPNGDIKKEMVNNLMSKSKTIDMRGS